MIKSICYPLKHRFTTKATEWGTTHEKDAFAAYIAEQSISHICLSVENVGLCIKPGFYSFGASPDGIVKCECCGSYCLEIKCPYLLKNMTVSEFAKRKTSCLIKKDNGIYLDQSHAYYFQIQQRMLLTNSPDCDFVVWSQTELFVERVLFSDDFWYSAFNKEKTFHNNVILPELLGKYFTRETNISTWCSCGTNDDEAAMIRCENDVCKIQWYHIKCVNLIDIPEDCWICPNCA